MAGMLRLDNVQHCVEDVLRRGVPGDLIETGVWRGGTTIFMRAILAAHGNASRQVWVADSMDALTALYPKLSPGGYAIIDDYGAIPACRQAVHDYRDVHGITEPIEPVDWTGAFWQRAM